MADRVPTSTSALVPAPELAHTLALLVDRLVFLA